MMLQHAEAAARIPDHVDASIKGIHTFSLVGNLNYVVITLGTRARGSKHRKYSPQAHIDTDMQVIKVTA